jgi:ERCC4-related helicase
MEQITMQKATLIMVFMEYKPTDDEILNFINKKSINRISLVSPILKQTIIEILINKQKL